MEQIKVTEKDLLTIINSQAQEIANLKVNIAVLSRVISEQNKEGKDVVSAPLS